MKIRFINTNRDDIFFDYDEITIGREEDNILQLESDGISRHHGRIYRTGSDEWFIEDLGSTNGIKLNDKKISAPEKLNENDIIDFHQEKLQICDFSPPKTITLTPSDTAKISLDDLIDPQTDNNTVSVDPVIIAPAEEKVNDIVISPAEEKVPEPAKEADFDKIAEFIQHNTGNLFNPARKKNDEKRESNTAERPRKFSNKLFYVVLACAILVIVAWSFNIMNQKQQNAAPVKTNENANNGHVYLSYIKEHITQDNVFRFSVIIEKGQAIFTVDDLKSQFRLGPITKPVSDSNIAKLKEIINQSNFFSLAPISDGNTSDVNRDYKQLEIHLGKKHNRIVLKNRPTPREIMDVEEAIDLIAESCNMRTVLLSPEELREEAENHYNIASDKFANYETNLSYLKEAISSFALAIEYMSGISPEPPIRREASEKMQQAINIRNRKIKEYRSQYMTMISQGNVEGAKQSLEALLKLYDENTREYTLNKQRLIKVDTILRKTKK